jgi:hypothetical protein
LGEADVLSPWRAVQRPSPAEPYGIRFKAKLFRYPGPGGWTWRDKKYGTLPPVSKAVRGDKGDGDTVTIELRVATR